MNLNQDYTKIIDEKRKVEKDFLSRSGVLSVGIGKRKVNNKYTDEIGIIVHVKNKKPENRLKESEKIPKEIKGFKTDVIEEKKELRLFSENNSGSIDHCLMQRPVYVGDSMSYDDTAETGIVRAGTSGFPVEKNGKRYALTCRHVVLGNDGIGQIIVQPSSMDGGRRQDAVAGDTRYHVGELSEMGGAGVDQAIVEMYVGYPLISILGNTFKRESRYSSFQDVGVKIYKEGRTTGYTRNEITAIDVTIILSGVSYHNNIECENINELTGADIMAAGGDSGSGCWIKDGVENLPFGILYAGNSQRVIMSEVQRALDLFNVEIAQDDAIAHGGLVSFSTGETPPTPVVGKEGFIWIQGSMIYYIDENEVKRRVKIGMTAGYADINKNGALWITNDNNGNLEYIDQFGYRRMVAKTLEGSYNVGEGKMWVQGNDLIFTADWTDPSTSIHHPGTIFKCVSELV